MPQALFIPITVSAANFALASALAAIWNTIIVNVALGAISKALTKKPKVYVPPVNVTIRNPTENRRLVFGRRRCGGTFAFYGTSSSGLTSDNKFLTYIVMFAGHQCADISDVWLDTNRIANSAIGGGAAEGGAVTTGRFANKLSIYKHRGTSGQAADAVANADFLLWDSSHRLRGISYVVAKMERDDAAYPNGAPQNLTALIDGALLYDPRLDSTNGGSGTHRRTDPSTWAFSRNPALAWRWFVSGGSVHNDSATRLIRYGLREVDARIPDAFTIAAANECDESLTGSVAPPSGAQNRYLCDLEVSTGETRRSILEDILATMAGAHVVVRGQHRVYAGAYDAPTHSFTEADLYDALEVEDTFDHTRRKNAIAAVFVDATKEWVEQTSVFRTNSTYETQDGGERIEHEIELRGVTDQYQAQRLSEIELRRTRMMRSVKLIGGLNLLKVALHETLNFSHARYGWTNRVFRCVERQLDLSDEIGKVELTCVREDAAVYTDLLTSEYGVGTSASGIFTNEKPDPPTNLRTTGLFNSILIEWARPALMFAGTTFDVRESTSSSMTSPTTVYQGQDSQFIIGKTTTGSFYYQVRSVRRGQPSDWVPATTGVLGRASSVSAALSATVNPGTLSSNTGAASQTTGSATVSPTGGTAPYTYSWAWFSGGTGITINSTTAAATSFTATGLTSGESRSGIARCTVTDSATPTAATYTVDVNVAISRPAPTITINLLSLEGTSFSPTDASVAIRFDADGHVYSSQNLASPATDRGLWCSPVEYAADYEINVTRTGGSASAFTSGPALATWHALSVDREWRMTDTTNANSTANIIFTIEIRRIADSGGLVTRTGNELIVTVETNA